MVRVGEHNFYSSHQSSADADECGCLPALAINPRLNPPSSEDHVGTLTKSPLLAAQLNSRLRQRPVRLSERFINAVPPIILALSVLDIPLKHLLLVTNDLCRRHRVPIKGIGPRPTNQRLWSEAFSQLSNSRG